MASNAWVVFRKARIALLGLIAVLALAMGSLFVFLLVKEWLEYSIEQRIIVIAIAGAHLFTAIFLYLVIVVQFRLLVDVARTALAILIEAGGAVTFALFSSKFPCRKMGLVSTCRTYLSVLQNAGWVIPGLLGLYGVVLIAMHYVPQPRTPSDDTEAYFPETKNGEKAQRTSVNSKTGLISSSKRYSTGSTGSSFIQKYTPSMMSEREAPPIAIVGPNGQRHQMPYRTGTPSSFTGSYHSYSSSAGSSVGGISSRPLMDPSNPPFQQSRPPYHTPSYSMVSDGGRATRPYMGTPQSASRPISPIANPFMEPPSRQQSPMSLADSMSTRSPMTLSPPAPAQVTGLPSSPRIAPSKLAHSPSDSAVLPLPSSSLFMATASTPAPGARPRVNSPGVRISQLPASLVASPLTRKASPLGPSSPSPFAGGSQYGGSAQNNGVYVPLLLSPALAPTAGLPQPARNTPSPLGYGTVYGPRY